MVSDDIFDQIGVCNSFITMFGKCGDLNKCVLIWNRIKVDKNIITWNSFMNACFWNGDYQKVMELYKDLMKLYESDDLAGKEKEMIRPQLKTFSICIFACMRLKDKEFGDRLYQDVMRMLDNMKHKDVFHSLVAMFYSCDGVDRAICVWREIGNSQPSLMGFTFMIHLCVQNGDNLRAFELFDEMQNDHHIKPDAAMFRIMLKACGSHKKMIDAMYRQTVSAELCMDKRTVSTLMTAYSKCGDKKSAGMIWKKYHKSERESSRDLA